MPDPTDNSCRFDSRLKVLGIVPTNRALSRRFLRDKPGETAAACLAFVSQFPQRRQLPHRARNRARQVVAAQISAHSRKQRPSAHRSKNEGCCLVVQTHRLPNAVSSPTTLAIVPVRPRPLMDLWASRERRNAARRPRTERQRWFRCTRRQRHCTAGSLRSGGTTSRCNLVAKSTKEQKRPNQRRDSPVAL